jgi:REP element-mobilizing transposase RayT
MVIGHHIIITAYGFWLPNDPRGSWSEWVRKWELLRFGPATKVETRRSAAGMPHDRKQREMAKSVLAYPPVRFTGVQAFAAAMGFKTAIQEAQYRCVACAIMPNHVHLVTLRHERTAEVMMQHFKAKASMQLSKDGLHPFAAQRQADGLLPSPWARKGWKVFLDAQEDVARAIRYVEQNPVKEGLPVQRWSFVEEYAPGNGGQSRPRNG